MGTGSPVRNAQETAYCCDHNLYSCRPAAGHQGPPTHVFLEMRQGLSYSKARTGPMSRKLCCCSVFECFGFFSLKINQSCQRALTLHRQTIFHNSLLLLNLLGKCPTGLMASHPLASQEMMKPSAGMSARKPGWDMQVIELCQVRPYREDPVCSHGTGDVASTSRPAQHWYNHRFPAKVPPS